MVIIVTWCIPTIFKPLFHLHENIMAHFYFSEPLDRLAPIFKEWVKEAIHELIPALTEIHSPEPYKDDLPEYLSPDETCKLLGLSLPTLRKHTRAGIYTAYRVGKRKIQYNRSEIAKALLARRIEYRFSSKLHCSDKTGGKR